MISLPAEQDDALLVERSLAGDRQAFGRIVGRYQSLVCALAYSATGSRSRSEDLAQETFLTAWKNLRGLREPGRLRPWLCGIARNLVHGEIRRLERQPAHAADALDTATAVASAEPLPTAQAVSNEEMAILWREVGRLPEKYREPLVLFYREHQSVERVAAALELSPDAVTQRLSRGRRLLQERMLAFVETTLERTNPGPAFTLQVTAALPVLIGAGPAAVAASTVAPSGALAKGGVLGLLLAWAAPLVGVFAAIGISWADIAQSPTVRERRFVARYTLALWLSVAGFVVAMSTVSWFAHTHGLVRRHDWLATAPYVALWFGYALIAVTLIVLMLRGKAALRRQMLAQDPTAVTPPPASLRRRILTVFSVMTAVFWVLIFVAWQSGDRATAVGIATVAFLLGAVPLWLAWKRNLPEDPTKTNGWYLALCGLVFLGFLNWRLDVWIAPMYGTNVEGLQPLMPMPLIHALSAFLIAWTALLVWLTRPTDTP